jgi:LmbE family N-acetylglucosaminyl deacetylase
MLLPSLDAAHDYQHIYLAPHLDDATLSCGGQIVLQTSAGSKVLVVTLCAASPAPDAELTPYAQHLHRTLGLGDDPTAARREEDRRALARLGCDGLHLDQLDAPYRVAAYGVRHAVFAAPVPGDPLGPAATEILTQIHAQQPSARLYVPLGVGLHVDHQIVCAVGFTLQERGAAVAWYEDAPYATDPDAVTQRLQMLPGPFVPEVIDIGAALDRKLSAIAEYRSQLGKLFREAPMEQVMRDYATVVAGAEGQFGERLWLREGPQPSSSLSS